VRIDLWSGLVLVFGLSACGGSVTPASQASTSSAPAAFARTPAGARPAKSGVPAASNIVVVIMENRDYDLIVGDSDAPFINGTLIPEGALMTDSHAVTHPSQPNYLALFSGSTQGITDDSCPHTFSTENFGAELLAKGAAFTGYSESMPSDGYTGCTSGEYARKHNPWVDFSNVPAASNLIYYDLPLGPLKKAKANVQIVVPNLCNDMHDCSTQTGDNWLKANAPTIIQYLQANNGLFVLTWDEAAPDADGTNHIATLLIGSMVKPGQYAQDINHYSVLRTLEDMTKVKCTASACKAKPLTGMWL
jgi:phosphatidylinositol-3-phosphatase